MVNMLITEIKQGMMPILNNAQMEHLSRILEHCFYNISVVETGKGARIFGDKKNTELLNEFLAAKSVEGCSKRTLYYYRTTINNMFSSVNKPVKHITTDDLRQYITVYQRKGTAGKVAINNIRNILSSFFSWMENENIILKSPMRRIRKLKTGTIVKDTYSDESMELIRDNCKSPRDLAIIDLLSSTGMRVGELIKLNRNDIDLINRECIVFGKGEKERQVYFDAKTKLHIQNYLAKRIDNNPALFVSLLKPYNRLQINGVEIRLRNLGKQLNIPKVHPHKFRRTLATKAIDKGMPIEQVQHLLGHQKIDTTLQYAMISQNNVKTSHKKYIS